MNEDEIQIVKGPDFIVTTKRIVFKSGEILVNSVTAPQIEEKEISASARMTVMAVGGVLLAGGLLAQFPIIWIIGALTCAFAPLANVKRRGLALTVGERREGAGECADDPDQGNLRQQAARQQHAADRHHGHARGSGYLPLLDLRRAYAGDLDLAAFEHDALVGDD